MVGIRIFLILTLIIFINTPLIYGLRPSEIEYSETSSTEKTAELNQEKEKIIESITPIRAERQKQLHPFVEPLRDKFSPGDSNHAVQYITKQGMLQEPKNEALHAKSSNYGLVPKAGINFTFLSLIALAFLLSYFFIRPKSR